MPTIFAGYVLVTLVLIGLPVFIGYLVYTRQIKDVPLMLPLGILFWVAAANYFLCIGHGISTFCVANYIR